MLTITIVFAVLALIFCVVEYLNGSRNSSGDFLKFDLSFNGEKIQGLGLFIDTRSEEQKAKNIRNGSLDGDVIFTPTIFKPTRSKRCKISPTIPR